MRARARVEVDVPSPEVICRALGPETKRPATPRSRVTINRLDDRLLLSFEASDVAALRASVSAYSRWLLALIEVLEVLKEEKG